MLFQYSEVLKYHWLSKVKQKHTNSRRFTIHAWPLLQKKYVRVIKYDYRDDNINNYRKKDVINYDSAAAGSESDGMIFDLITTPQSILGIAEEDQATRAMVLQLQHTIYICVGL